MNNFNRLYMLKSAFKDILTQMTQGDTFSLITFNNESQVIIVNQEINNNLQDIFNTIDKINATESTSLMKGIESISLEMIKHNPNNTTVLLCTDGMDQKLTSARQVIQSLQKPFRSCKNFKQKVFNRIIPIGIGEIYNREFMAEIADFAGLPSPVHIVNGTRFEDTVDKLTFLFGKRTSLVEVTLNIFDVKYTIKFGKLVVNQPISTLLEIETPANFLKPVNVSIDIHCDNHSDIRTTTLDVNVIDYNIIADFIYDRINLISTSYMPNHIKACLLKPLYEQCSAPPTESTIPLVAAQASLERSLESYLQTHKGGTQTNRHESGFNRFASWYSLTKPDVNKDYSIGQHLISNPSNIIDETDFRDYYQTLKRNHCPNVTEDMIRLKEILSDNSTLDLYFTKVVKNQQIYIHIQKLNAYLEEEELSYNEKMIIMGAISYFSNKTYLPFLFKIDALALELEAQVCIPWDEDVSLLLDQYYVFFTTEQSTSLLNTTYNFP